MSENRCAMSKVLVIAEVGECFNGNMKTAEKLINASKEAGCDIVKFQVLDSENIAEDDPEREWLKKVSLDRAKIKQLIAGAKRTGIEILFTPENAKTAKWLSDARQSAVKIASSSITDMEYIRYVNEHFNRVYISTGMASLEEVAEAVRGLNKVRGLSIMHCVSEYPTGPLLEKRGLKALANSDVRLNMMRILMDLFPQHVIGYSDHTSGILAPIVAVAMGARVIEKHITMDRKTPVNSFKTGKKYLGTDHVLSLEPGELKEMVRQIREIEKMFGDKEWKRSSGEEILKVFLRKRFSGEKSKIRN